MYKHDGTIKPFAKKLWLASPTMHGEELKYMQEAYETNWMWCFAVCVSSWSLISDRMVWGQRAEG